MVPVIMIAVALGVGTLYYIGTSMNEVQDLYAESSTNTQERLQERIVGEYEGSPTNIEQAKVLSEWTDDTRVVGIMVECPSGAVFTAEVDEMIPGGELVEIPTAILTEMQNLAGRC